MDPLASVIYLFYLWCGTGKMASDVQLAHGIMAARQHMQVGMAKTQIPTPTQTQTQTQTQTHLQINWSLFINA